ncbi:hypothetical protein GPECTOR_22g766 [Gonium pectorale]|uniref:FCP1 homology domain-containing protein n=1 Tax=Gonium pectorale TaxID=33097 RepID=A0A150GH68_GONPE|nr:hypothetical protein GPECTOR_22g766 [Gonium pectorale]|eukprot:KXZ49176.1 hypothetical protein GPECTOR_22g766 [Gonium pectorale]
MPYNYTATLLLAAVLVAAIYVPTARAQLSWSGLRSGWGGAAGSGAQTTRSREVPENPPEDNSPDVDLYPPPPASVPQGTCVCAFDFDGVLRAAPPGAADQDTPAPEARMVVDACKAAGWAVAICSSNDSPAKMKMVLGQRLDPSTFTPQFFNSPAFQIKNDNKTPLLRNIIRYHQTLPQCVAFFDDRNWNKEYAAETGVLFIKTPTNKGIRYSDWLRAQQVMTQYCDCVSR